MRSKKIFKTSNGLRLGQRVEMTDLALRQGLDGCKHARTGMVYSIHLLNLDYVGVLRDGKKQADHWHVSMWKRCKSTRAETSQQQATNQNGAHWIALARSRDSFS